jgi:hypothetical protein
MNSREITRTSCRNRAVANCQKFGGILKFPDIYACAVPPEALSPKAKRSVSKQLIRSVAKKVSKAISQHVLENVHASLDLSRS